MADVNMPWWHPKTWLWITCGLIGLILGGILIITLKTLDVILSFFSKKQ
jgi:hypothetical protein